MPRIFLSYRREDSAYPAQAVFDALVADLGPEAVFMDLHRLPFGRDFRHQLLDAVASCDVLLPIIGDNWLTARFSDGRRRLDDPRDFVRVEIEAAISSAVSILPVLVGDASMPSEEQLPAALRDLCYLHAAELRPGRAYNSQMRELVDTIDRLCKSKPSQQQPDAPATPSAALPSPLRDDDPILPPGGECFTNSVGTLLRTISAGDFSMGSPDSDEDADEDEKPRHSVRITEPFLVGVHPVTQDEYEMVCSTNYRLQQGMGSHPVVNVSWLDAIQFCNLLSEIEGLLPCYEVQEAGAGIVSNEGYRLLTEADWEYACRAGTTTKWSHGDDGDLLGEYACFAGASLAPVGSKKANAWGLCDMHGNVWEWCWDWYAERYESLGAFPRLDPQGPLAGQRRVVRGGSFYFQAWNARSAYRMSEPPSTRSDDIGFRVGRSLSGVRPGCP